MELKDCTFFPKINKNDSKMRKSSSAADFINDKIDSYYKKLGKEEP